MQSLKEISLDIPYQVAISSGKEIFFNLIFSKKYPLYEDNVPVTMDGILFLHIKDSYKASYEVMI